MTPRKRSTLQLDLKDLTCRQSTPVLRHLGMVSLATGVLLATYILVNAPSASTTAAITAKGSTLKGPALGQPDIAEVPAPLEAIKLAVRSDTLPFHQINHSPPTQISGTVQVDNSVAESKHQDLTQGILTRVGIAGFASEDSVATSVSESPAFESPESAPPAISATDRTMELAAVNQGDFPGDVVPLRPQPDSPSLDIVDEPADTSKNPKIIIQKFNPEPGSIVMASLGLPRSRPSFSSRSEKPVEDLSLSAIEKESGKSLPQPIVEMDYAWITATVKKQDTLSRIFKRHGLKIQDAYAVAKLEDAAALLKIRPGQEIQLATGEQGKLVALRYNLDKFSRLTIIKEDELFSTEVVTRTPEIRIRSENATIWTSVLAAAKDADIDFETVYGLTQMFGWQVDFAREIQGGDQFSMIFEELYLDDKKVGNGDILAAELIASSKRLRAIRHVDEDGRVAYYAPNGDGVERSFLRSPVKFGRVTSRFSNKRFHPILKKWRAHKGVDYGASKGTPVMSTGDGVIKLAGRSKGYGKTITIRHGSKYTTLYAHLSGFAKSIKSGARVRQGDVIGYVGRTGWATGPHLHYEFRVNGAHRNPLTAELPKSTPIDKKYKQEFLDQANIWATRLDRVSYIPLARNDITQ